MRSALRLTLSALALGSIGLGALFIGHADASMFGRDGFSGNPGTNAGATCNACHATGATRPTVTITGPQTLDADTIADYTVTITGGPAVTGGVGVSSTNNYGALSPADASMHVVGSEVSHTQPKAFSGNSVSFTFRYRAPTWNGPVTLYAAGNSSNGQLNLLGDGIQTAQLAVTVQNGSGTPPTPPTPPATRARLVSVASGLARPVVITHAGDRRLFVVEQSGLIRILDANRTLLPTPFMDITDRVDDAGNEQGLLGLAFDPAYASNGRFYVNYVYDPPSSSTDRIRISRFVAADPAANTASPASETVLMEFDHTFSNHNGGDLHFGPDGYLYISSGDGGSGDDPQNNAQNRLSMMGKLLRIDVNGGGSAPDCNLVTANHYGIPPSNAFTDGDGGAGCDEIFALGLRNPWRFTFDGANGDLWIADVGQNQYEEIDYVPAGASAGINFGWRCYEGNNPYITGGCTGSYFAPLLTTTHSDGNCSITGGRVYRGVREPALAGAYFFTDYCLTSIRSVRRNGGLTVENAINSGQISQPVAFGEDLDGEIYVASLTGTIYRMRSSVASTVTQFKVQSPPDRCLQLAGNATAAGTALIAPNCRGRPASEPWQLRDDGTLYNHRALRCASVPGGNTTPGAVQLALADCSTADAQRFHPTALNQLKGIGGLCVEESATVRGRVQMGVCNGSVRQKWMFSPLKAQAFNPANRKPLPTLVLPSTPANRKPMPPFALPPPQKKAKARR